MVTYLISGTSRGLGLALVERLTKDSTSNIIYAGARTPETAKNLQQRAEKSAGQIRVIQLDPTSVDSVESAIKRIDDEQGSLDVLINNAGAAAGDRDGILDIDLHNLQSNFDINVTGVIRLTNAALPLLRESSIKHIVIMSSVAGTFSFFAQIGTALASAYAPTKAAASMVGVHYAMLLKPEGFRVTNVHPGIVKTDMGGPDAYIEIDESINGLVKVFGNAKLEDAPVLYNYDGTVLPW